MASSAASGAISTCDVRPDRDGLGGARVDTAYFCTNKLESIQGTPTQFTLDVSAVGRIRIGILPILGNEGSPYVSPEGIAEATINGGTKASLPPFLIDVGYATIGGGTVYRVTGAFLADITDARISQPQGGTIIPIGILHTAADSAVFRGPLLERVRSGLLEVRNRLGEWTSIPIDWARSGLRRVEAPRLLIRVERRALLASGEPGAAGSDAANLLVPVLASALAQAGVASMRPLFPGESGKGDHEAATNVIGEPIELDPLDDWFLGTLGLDVDAPKALESVRSIPGVREAAEERWASAAHVTPNDPSFGQQWGLSNSGGTVCGYSAILTSSIFADQAWNQTTGSPNVRMAILDSGINPFHEDFAGRVQLGPDFVNGGSAADDNGHGTSVAGIAAAVGNNGTGVAGVAWQLQPWAVKVLDEFAGGVPPDLSSGIAWADSVGIPILNMSLGWNDPSEIGAADRSLLATLTLRALKHGRFLVASSGNAREALGPFNACPADLDKRVYAVGAFLPNGNRWRDIAELAATDCSAFNPCSMSNFGGFLDAVAPGGRLIVTTDLGPTDYLDLSGCVTGNRSTMAFSGTSAAAPFVSGIAALLLARRPELSGEDIAQILNRTTPGPNPPNNWVPEYGWGRVNGLAALNFVGPSKTIAHWGAGPGPFTLGALAVVDSTYISPRLFRDVPGLPSTYTTSGMRYRLRATLAWPFSFQSDIKGWTRSSGTLAWKDKSPYFYNEEVDTATFVPATFGTTGATVEAFVFRLKNASDTTKTIGWFPTDPAHASVAFTVVGTASGTTGIGPATVAAQLAVTTFPNPTRDAVRLSLDIPARGHVRTLVLDLAGRRVATVVERELEAGRSEFWWDGRREGGGRCPAGVYFCRVDYAGLSTTTRFIRLSGNR
jgi:subtilisin family serine protease